MLQRQFIFRWNGQPVGYVHENALYNLDNEYLGWVEKDETVWSADGHYMGEYIEKAYILRNTTRLPPLPRLPRAVPLVPPPPSHRPDPRMPRIPRSNWIDGI